MDQDFLNQSHDNMVNDLRLIVEIDAPGGTIYASDRNIYVGDTFYQALLKFPPVLRTLGDWLTPTLQFSVQQLELNNSDGRFNNILPGGVDFGGWIQRPVVIKLGLRDVASTYTTIFRGRITEVGGYSRTVKSIKLVARDEFEKINEKFPSTPLTLTNYPNIEDRFIGKVKPVVYGDWTTAINTEIGASVPAIPLNTFGIANTVNVEYLISENANASFDTTKVYLVRSSEAHLIAAADIANVGANNDTFEIKQSGSGGVTLINGVAWDYKSGDKIYVQVTGKDLGAYDDNIVEIARDIMITYTGVTGGDFDANWDTFRDKAAPAESAISTFKARVYRDKPEKAITFALSLLEQVRLESFIDRNLKFKINSLHLDDFPAVSAAFDISNWDLEKASFTPKVDERNNFNRVQGIFNFLPDLNDELNLTPFYRNQDSIDILSNGKVIEKGVVFPNLYVQSTVNLQVQEILKMSSSFFEIIDARFTWRSLLLDLGDFVALDIDIGSTILTGVPCMVRNIGYDSKGMKLPVKLWSFQMTPYPNYIPGYPNTVGGSTATITEET
jgi:hypothetical protein